jgi:quinol monooxygenase YgiN
MITHLQNNDALHAGQQTQASNLIVVELRRERPSDLAQQISGFVDSMAVLPNCFRYALAPHPTDRHTLLIQGDWSCPLAMAEHFESALLQALIGYLRSSFVYRMEFSCQGLTV